MKKAHAIQWINALRSGKYKQGRVGYLKDKKGGYCCLGVLNELFPKLNLSGGSTICLENAACIGLQPNGELHHVGADKATPWLSELNDGSKYLNIKRFTFEEIADIIQIEYVEGL